MYLHGTLPCTNLIAPIRQNSSRPGATSTVIVGVAPARRSLVGSAQGSPWSSRRLQGVHEKRLRVLPAPAQRVRNRDRVGARFLDHWGTCPPVPETVTLGSHDWWEAREPAATTITHS